MSDLKMKKLNILSMNNYAEAFKNYWIKDIE